MKTIFKTVLSVCTGILLLTACGKDGSMGPQGETGPQGAQGTQGIPGVDGSVIFSGTAVPASSLGKVGDFYFRTSNSDFYGPKTASGWGMPTNLRGANGATGATGSRILTGTALPAASTGAVGDFYIHIGTADMYGPKQASGWGLPLMNLRGTANVIYSGWILPTEASWNGANTARYKQMIINEPRVTADVVARGVVLMYRQSNNGTTTPLPQTVYNATTGNAEITFTHLIRGSSTLHLMIRSFTRDIGPIEYLNAPPGMSGQHARFRYVIIPGGVSNTASSGRSSTGQVVEIKGKAYSKTSLEKMDYQEIRALLDIKD